MKTVSYNWDGHGSRPAIVLDEGKKAIRIVPFYLPIRVRRVPKSEARYFKDITLRGKPYPLKRALKFLRGYVQRSYGTLRSAPKTVREIFK
jgi:hypothetical protein